MFVKAEGGRLKDEEGVIELIWFYADPASAVNNCKKWRNGTHKLFSKFLLNVSIGAEAVRLQSDGREFVVLFSMYQE